MDLESLKQSVENDAEPPAELNSAQRALWCARRERWDEAHELVQDDPSSLGSWIHGHLHLIEGDLGNAAYWYSRAGRPAGSRGRIDEDWETIAAAAADQE